MLVEVFESEYLRKKYYYVVGYLFFVIVVGVLVVIDYKSYGIEKVCWFYVDNYFIWSFIGFVIFIILLNIVFLVIILCKMVKYLNILKLDFSRLENIKFWVFGVFVFLCFFGFIWLFGLFFINEEIVVMVYFFIIFNVF